MYNLYGFGDLFITFTLITFSFKTSNPTNFTIAGSTTIEAFDPTLSYSSVGII